MTEYRANLHNDLLARLLNGSAPTFEADLYAVAYRPFTRGGESSFDIWPERLELGGRLPKLPLCLKAFRAVGVDLDATYAETCAKLLIAA